LTLLCLVHKVSSGFDAMLCDMADLLLLGSMIRLGLK
jgi:hypothetical protein